MWIAKPVRALLPEERAAWIRIPAKPLAQTLAWADAADALRPGHVFLVFSPDEGVGGVVLTPASAGALECVNGPLLNWEDPAHAPRQLATFAMAATRAAPGFRSLTLRPRWTEGARARIEPHLPLEARAWSRAQTLELDLAGARPPEAARLRRTLRRADAAGVRTEAGPLDDPAGFRARMAEFARARGFHVPPAIWFEALRGADARELRLTRVSAAHAQADAELLVASGDEGTHYLFGRQRRDPGAPAWLSVSAPAQRAAIERAAAEGARRYDFNGFATGLGPADPYAGVAAFKAQFGGRIVRYEVPEFVIA